MEEWLDNDDILNNAISFLVAGDEKQVASMLLADAKLEIEPTNNTWYYGNRPSQGVHVNVKTSIRRLYECLEQANDPVTISISKAIEAVLPDDLYVSSLSCRMLPLENYGPFNDWRAELFEIMRGTDVNNQALVFNQTSTPLRTWNNLRFRSASEIRIAEALDKKGVLFLPNCMARLNTPDGRRNREADFLICHNGKWGILEVDGEDFHPETRTVDDHHRDRYFRKHGIPVVEHFDAPDCYNDADSVVETFLGLLEKAPE